MLHKQHIYDHLCRYMILHDYNKLIVQLLHMEVS